MPLILIGFMAAGKSSVARLISEHCVDTDDYISQKVGLPLSDFIENSGLAEFRRLEETALTELVGHSEKIDVIATGGGIVESEKNQKLLLAEKNVVYLKADFEIILKRISADSKNKRPLFEHSSHSLHSSKNGNENDFRELFDRRAKIYECLSDFTIDTSDKSLNEVSHILELSFKKN